MKLNRIQKKTLRYIYRTFPTPFEENPKDIQPKSATQPPTIENICSNCDLTTGFCERMLSVFIEHNLVRKVHRFGSAEYSEVRLAPGITTKMPRGVDEATLDPESRGCECYQITNKGIDRLASKLPKTLWIAIPTIAILLTGAWNLAKHFNWFHINDPVIVVPPPLPNDVNGKPAESFVPVANGAPTVVAFESQGDRENLIQQVIFNNLKTTKTPNREKIMGQAPPIRIIYTNRDYDPAKNQFLKRLQNPKAVKDEWTTLEMSIVDPKQVGRTYIGTVTIFFNGDKQRQIENPVEIDVVAEPPNAD